VGNENAGPVTSSLSILHHNEAYTEVQSEEHISRELRDYLTFAVPGAHFSPKYKARLWDGKIRLLDARNRVYRGLVPYIKSWAQAQDYTFEHDEVDEELSIAEALEFIKTLNLPSHIVPRDYQIKAFVKAIRKRRILLLSPTASGKSLIIYLILRYLHAHLRYNRTLIVVPTTGLVGQLTTDFRDYGYDSDSLVHGIRESETKETSKPVIISTWQGIQHQPKKWFEQFDSLFGDEAHLFKAKALTFIATSCVNARARVGCTGTLDGSKTHRLIIEGLFGPVYKVITTKDLMIAKQVADFRIKILQLKHSAKNCALMRNATYQEEIKYLVESESRNNFIQNLALSLETNTLILFQYVSHGEALYKALLKKAKQGRHVYFIHGEVEADVRNAIREIVEKQKDAIIVASYGTFSTGINIKNLHNVIFASPSKSRVRNLQSIGRTLRLGSDKERALLFDIADDLRHKQHENYTLKHLLERIKIYLEEKFIFKIYKIELKG
jgi:superfamily II DNA or RNA helicase